MKNERPKRWVSLDEVVVEAAGSSQSAVRELVEEVFSAIREHCMAGRRVYVPRFGVFRPMKRAARTVRNPQTKELMRLPEMHSFGLRMAKGGVK